jgi:hypothetical protein
MQKNAQRHFLSTFLGGDASGEEIARVLDRKNRSAAMILARMEGDFGASALSPPWVAKWLRALRKVEGICEPNGRSGNTKWRKHECQGANATHCCNGMLVIHGSHPAQLML